MSVEAITWALKSGVSRSSTKFVLVAMANCADDETNLCYPSIQYLCKATSQDRKTVLENIRRLKEDGYLTDSGERKGATGQVIVYRLHKPESAPSKEAQKRNGSENGTVPKFPSNSPVFPAEQSRFSAETGPKTGHGTIIEPSIEPSGNHHKRGQAAPAKFDAAKYLMQNGVDKQVANDWLLVRKEKRASPSQTAIDGVLRQIEKAHMTPDEGLRICCERGWAAFRAEWIDRRQESAGRIPERRNSHLGPAGQATALNAQRWLEAQQHEPE